MFVVTNFGVPGGPGDCSNHQTGISALLKAGINVIGYVFTNRGKMDIGTVESQVDQWKNCEVNGIFYDVMAYYDAGSQMDVGADYTWYSALTNYVKSHDGLQWVVGNPGAATNTNYLSTVDIMNVFEDSYLPTPDTVQSYASSLSPEYRDQLSILPYNVQSSSSFSQNTITAYLDIVKYVYISSGTPDHNWFSIPSYLNTTLSYMSQSPPVNTLTLSSQDSNGNSIQTWITVTDVATSKEVCAGNTTFSCNDLATGKSYTITANDFGKYTFNHWNPGSIGSRSYTFTFSSSTTYTAVYNTNTPTTPSLTVNSKWVTGQGLNGMWTELWDSNNNLIGTGYTNITYSNLNAGTTYTIAAAWYKNILFDHWSDGSTNRYHQISVSQPTTIIAYYRNALETITVNSKLLNGAILNGMYTVISSDGGAQLGNGFTPIVYNLTAGQTYAVNAQNYNQYVFDHWSDNTTTNPKDVDLTTNTTLTAYYKQVTPEYNIQGLTQWTVGPAITGMFMQLYQNGQQIATGYSPVTFTGLSSGTYTLYADDYSNRYFDHWSDGTTSRGITINLTGNATLIAEYHKSPSSITVDSEDMFGNKITGLYMQLDNSQSQQIGQGYTPVTFSGLNYALYTIYSNNYCNSQTHQDYIFDHWGDGNTIPNYGWYLQTDTNMVAVYKVTSC